MKITQKLISNVSVLQELQEGAKIQEQLKASLAQLEKV